MNSHSTRIKIMALAIGLAFGTGTFAQGMSKSEYQSGKDKIEAQYKLDKSGCRTLSGNSNDICTADANGKEKVAKADLEASYKPSLRSHYEARVARAETDYAVARERCDDTSGNAKDVCVKEAKAREAIAMADAKVQMKTSDANATAGEKAADARRDAANDKLDALYNVAREKCDSSVGYARDACIKEAKARFAK